MKTIMREGNFWIWTWNWKWIRTNCKRTNAFKALRRFTNMTEEPRTGAVSRSCILFSFAILNHLLCLAVLRSLFDLLLLKSFNFDLLTETRLQPWKSLHPIVCLVHIWSAQKNRTAPCLGYQRPSALHLLFPDRGLNGDSSAPQLSGISNSETKVLPPPWNSLRDSLAITKSTLYRASLQWPLCIEIGNFRLILWATVSTA